MPGFCQADEKFCGKLCDGEWHTLHAVKDKHKLSLTVDGISAQDVEGNEKVRDNNN